MDASRNQRLQYVRMAKFIQTYEEFGRVLITIGVLFLARTVVPAFSAFDFLSYHAAREVPMTTFGNISRFLNRVSGGPRGQTLCARLAARNPKCWLCRWLEWVEPNHCLRELARWERRGMYCARRLRWG